MNDGYINCANCGDPFLGASRCGNCGDARYVQPHRTAIARKQLSSPAALLWNDGCIFGRVLDYGSGRGSDARILRDNGADATEYDPFYAPEEPQGEFDVILCTYVLNVIERFEVRQAVLTRIGDLLKENGTAYVTVRRDIAKTGRTASGTWQGMVEMYGPCTSEVEVRGAFETFRLTKSDCYTTVPMLRRAPKD